MRVPRTQELLAWIGQNRVEVRFVLAGGLNTLFGLAAFPALYYLLKSLDLHYLVILSISHILSVTFAFLMNKFLVFKTVGNAGKEYARFISFHAAHLGFNMAVLPAIVHLTDLSPVVSQIIFAFAVIISSYFWHSRITFSSRKAVP